MQHPDQLIFVYGSLKPGFRNAAVLAAVAPGPLQAAHIPASAGLVMVAARHGRYPYVVRAAAVGLRPTMIHGFLATVSTAGRRRLDRFERCPSDYRRVPVTVICAGARQRAEMYQAAHAAPREAYGPRIARGTWCES